MHIKKSLLSLVAVLAAALMVPSAQAADGSIYKIDNLFYNDATYLASGLAVGLVDRLIFFDSADTCFQSMWRLGQKASALSKMSKVRSDLDNYVVLPLNLILTGVTGFQAVYHCIDIDPNLLSGWFGTATDTPVYDMGFYLKTVMIVLGLASQTLSLVSNMDLFQLGKTVMNYLMTIGVIGYNYGHYYL